MTDSPTSPPPGWYHAEGDPPATERYWDGNRWTGQPRPVSGGTSGQPPATPGSDAPQAPGQPAPYGAAPTPGQPGPGQPTPAGQPPAFGAPPATGGVAGGQPPTFGAPPAAGGVPGGQAPSFGAPAAAGGAIAGGAMGAGAAMGGGAPGAESWAAAPGRELAGAGSRIGARIIDGILIGIITAVLAVVLGYVGGIVGILIGFGYEAGLVATQGATLGKKMLGLGVLSEADNAYPPGWTPAITRWAVPGALSALGSLIPALSRPLGGISVIIILVSLFFLFTDDRLKTVWDRVAKTVVVKV